MVVTGVVATTAGVDGDGAVDAAIMAAVVGTAVDDADGAVVGVMADGVDEDDGESS